MAVLAKELDEYSDSNLPEGKEWFVPAADGSWRPVGEDQICEKGLEYRIDFDTGQSYARLNGGKERTLLAPGVAKYATPAAARAEASGRAYGDGLLSVGQKVNISFEKGRRKGTQETAVIRKVNKDGSVNVEFDVTGDRDMNIPRERVHII